MKNIKAYVRKNPVFVSLVSILLLISIGLGIYYVMNIQTNDSMDNKDPQVHTEVPTKAEIKSFEGNYNGSKEVILNWSIANNKEVITNVSLYHKDTFIADVTNLTTYTLPQSVYQFPSGTNEFTLKITKDNGEEVKKTTSIEIDVLTDMEFSSELVDEGMVITLQYKYDKSQTISIPNISVFGAKNEYIFEYKETSKEEDGNTVQATTQYHMYFKNPKYTETVKIRWFFETLNKNYDYSLKVEGKEKSTNEQDIE